MYPSNYNMAPFNGNMYRNSGMRGNRVGDRFFGGGFVAPLLLGGIAGYALGRPNYYPAPMPYPAPIPYNYPNTYYNNFYYYPDYY